MTFDEILVQVLELLQREGRLSYPALKLRFNLDDPYLEALKAELIKAKRLAVDEDGEVLVWAGKTGEREAKSVESGKAELREPSVAPRSTLHAQRSDGELRQLTVQFIDLVGSTTLSQQLDPEEYHARVVAYQSACHQIIARYEGHIAQYLGDGVLVYFGYPIAHEDDAVRAVRSGLEIVTAVSQLAYTPPLQVRVGIHTGPVMVGEIGAGEHTERLALGETPNIAARVQGQAEPNTVFISQATSRLVQGFFTCEGLGPQSLKNVAAPLALYRVHGEGEAHTRFEVSVQKGLTPLVGRESELGLLRQRWEQAKSGAGQVVLLSGEPGIGKSRLVQEFKEQLAPERAIRIEFRCSPYHQNSALSPIIDHLQRLLQFVRDDSPVTKLEKLQHTLRHYRFPQAETLPLLAALLSLPHPEGAPPITLSPQKQKQKTQEALVAWIVEEADKAAVYCAWEDLHWADPSTIEVLTLFLDQVPPIRLLALLTFRSEFMPPWGNRSHLSQLTLNRLGRSQVEAMVGQVAGDQALPGGVLQQIVAKTDGVPLFIEELTKTVLGSVESIGSIESQSGGFLQTIPIPATLHDSLMARLDRLGGAKEVAQLGATIGREFSYELLHAVSTVGEEPLQQGLKQLVEAELVYQRGLGPQVRYILKHALIQETAYQSLLKSKRQQLHQQIAIVLEGQFPDATETQPELVGHHYTEAGLAEQAVPYWQKAGQRASQRSAYIEAIAHLTKGLELLKMLPDTPERTRQELTLQIALGGPLIATKGYTAPDVEKVYARARELCRHVGETPLLFPVLCGLYRFYWLRGESRTATELGEQLLRLAQSVQDPALLLLAHQMWGANLFFQGKFAQAQEHLEQGMALYNRQQHHSLAVHYVLDPGMLCLVYAAGALWCLGYPDQALKRVHEALALARELSHPASLAYALNWAGIVHQIRREGPAAQKLAEEIIALSTEQGFPYYLADGINLQGWTLAEQGQAEVGIAKMRQSQATYQAIGVEMQRPFFLAPLAAAHGKIGQIEEGLGVLAEALTLVDKTGICLNEAELYRLKGELTFQSKGESQKSKAEEAEACFHKALDIARQRQAKSLELRATMSLARLWQQQGKKAEAHNLLSEIYGWFTEGFDTKDLQEAKALLAELAEG